MAGVRSALQSFFSRSALLGIAVLIGLAFENAPAIAAGAAKLQGSVQSGGSGLSGYKVSLYLSVVDRGPPWKFLGSHTTNAAGNFEIAYSLLPGVVSDPSILFVQAERGPVMLASAIGLGSNAPTNI